MRMSTSSIVRVISDRIDRDNSAMPVIRLMVRSADPGAIRRREGLVRQCQLSASLSRPLTSYYVHAYHQLSAL